VQIAPTTKYGEEVRRIDAAVDALPGAHEQLRRSIGIVRKVHEQYARLVKATDAYDGSILANGEWITLNHTAQEIAERWGTIQIGFKIQLTMSGPAGETVDAKVIGESAVSTTELHVPNSVARGLFAIFAPGIGIG
jgi:hypothetical protein